MTTYFILTAARGEFSGYLGVYYAGFIQNLMMSVLFIDMLKKREVKEQSLPIAISKTIWTLAPTLMVYFANGSFLLIAVGICIFVFDCVYIYLLILDKVHRYI